MPTNQWYPSDINTLTTWHANFASRASFNGTTVGLTAGQVTQIGVDSSVVASSIITAELAETYKKAVIQWRDAYLKGDVEAQPVPPPQPDEILALASSKGAIKKRTLGYAAIIKASPSYTPTIGAEYGIVGSGPVPLLTPGVIGTAEPFSAVKLKISKRGYDVLAIDMKRGAGAWTQVGVSQRSSYTDHTPPLVADQPEVREYRVQGMKDSVRVGDLSLHTTVVTRP